MNLYKFATLFFWLLLSCQGSEQVSNLPKEFQAKVTAIKDGDTIKVLYKDNPITIRLAHIDCPEIKKHQPFAQAAKKFTSNMCFGQIVKVENNGEFDRFKRLVAVVINNKNENVNKALVKVGLAWHFLKYSTDSSYDKLETIARQNKIGIWADENPIPPWLWRKP